MSRLIPILFGVISLMIGPSFAQAEPERLLASDAHQASLRGELLIVDVRTPHEWRASGVPRGAAPLNMRDPEFVQKLSSLIEEHPGKRVAFICATGVRSDFVANRLEEFGFSGLAEISEGVHGSAAGPGWLARGLPTQSVGD